jgi:hypothetical protein
VRQPEPGLFKCVTLNPGGWLAVIFLAICFPFVAWIPCCLSFCHSKTQVPVYGDPSLLPIAMGYQVQTLQAPQVQGAPPPMAYQPPHVAIGMPTVEAPPEKKTYIM